jgi:DNA-binding NarL/FixJ family response regulator
MTMRAIIVDDEELARRGIRALLKLNPALHLQWAVVTAW